MSAEAAPAAAGASPFSPRTVLTLVLVGIIAFAGFTVLGVYAPDLRAGTDTGAHALSGSAVGYRGATILLKELGVPVEVNRAPPAGRRIAEHDLLVLTPGQTTQPSELHAFPYAKRILIVLPKWLVLPDPNRPSYVRKIGPMPDRGWATRLLKIFAGKSPLQQRKGWSQPVLHGANGLVLPLGRIEALQTLSGVEWIPLVTDETGAGVLVQSNSHPDVFVLADPDLLNNQGLAQLPNARAGIAVLRTVKGDANGVVFDVTLSGFARGRSIGRLMLEPPWLAATLCAVAAAVLMFFHALARFGPAHERGRAIALGTAALVDNSAGLVRMARKEAALAPQYVELAKSQVARAGGADPLNPDAWLAALARRRGLEEPEALAAEAARAKSRDDALAIGRKLYRWRREMTRERR
jgi:hypothetical protein